MLLPDLRHKEWAKKLKFVTKAKAIRSLRKYDYQSKISKCWFPPKMVPNLRVNLSEFCYGFLNSTRSFCMKRAAEYEIHLFIIQLKLKLQMTQNLLDLAKSSFMLLAIVKKLWSDFFGNFILGYSTPNGAKFLRL